MADQFSPNPVKTQILLSFPDAIAELIKGKTITRVSWDKQANSYGLLVDGWLTIHIDGEFKVWKVNDGDLLATDWITLE